MNGRNFVLTALAMQMTIDSYLQGAVYPGPKAPDSDNLPTPRPIVKPQPVQLHEFNIKGCKIMAKSRKDAIKIYKHRSK